MTVMVMIGRSGSRVLIPRLTSRMMTNMMREMMTLLMMRCGGEGPRPMADTILIMTMMI